MDTKFRSKKFLNLFNIPLLFFFAICEIDFLNRRLYANTKTPASQQDIFLYKQMGASYLCKSINDKIDFDFEKAFAVSTHTFAEVIFSKHGNLIEGSENEKLTSKLPCGPVDQPWDTNQNPLGPQGVDVLLTNLLVDA